jgi:cellulose synthase/poly-beta-1,6-N-acetylglucosamine synthase-like glycosyltransferase
MLIVIALIYGLILTFEVFLVLSFQFHFKLPKVPADVHEQVSVLVCARDEEGNLARCLDSLLASDYDLSQVEILVGDDNSTDQTWSIIQSYEQHEAIRGIKIQHEQDGLIAKGNVLAQLVDEAQFDKILIIDADMEVSPSWLGTMTSLLSQNDLISGFTMVEDKGKYGLEQYFDWLLVLHSMKAMADAFGAISILGNNMGFRREAYDQVGGFKAQGATDVEDLALMRMFQKAGFGTFQYIGKAGFALTQPQLTFDELSDQRVRWMNGVFTHHWLLVLPAFFCPPLVSNRASCFSLFTSFRESDHYLRCIDQHNKIYTDVRLYP